LERPDTRRVVLAGAIGNVLEWYDFAVYGYFAAAIGRAFFPKEDPVAQVLSAFGIFAVGFLMRPVGGALLGYVGDRFGRRTALTVSVAAMAIPTFLVGVLPGYAVLGVAAPFVLTGLRMIQGLSVGGEYTTSIVFMVEHAPPERRGFIGAMAGCGAIGGILLGSATGGAILAELMPATALEAWGWRIPFVLGLAVGLAGFFLRRTLVDEPRTRASGRSPLVETVRTHWPVLLRLAGLSCFNAVGFYLSSVYIVSWLQFADGIAPAHALGINTFSMVAMLLVMVGAGLLSDRIGRKPMLLMATFIGVIGAYPFFWLMYHGEVSMILLGQLGFALAVGMFVGAQPTAMVEAAPVEVRCTAIALGYNLTLGLVGGVSPMVATWLVHRTGDNLMPAFLILGAAAVSLVATLFLRETSRSTLAVTPA